MNDFNLYSKLSALPEDLKKEADDFLEFLKTKIKSKRLAEPRKAGLAKGLIEMKDDFDEPLDDFEGYLK